MPTLVVLYLPWLHVIGKSVPDGMCSTDAYLELGHRSPCSLALVLLDEITVTYSSGNFQDAMWKQALSITDNLTELRYCSGPQSRLISVTAMTSLMGTLSARRKRSNALIRVLRGISVAESEPIKATLAITFKDMLANKNHLFAANNVDLFGPLQFVPPLTLVCTLILSRTRFLLFA